MRQRPAQQRRTGWRSSTVCGSVNEALPGGHDVLLLSLILHGENEARDREIVRKCFEALPSGGALLISEPLIDEEKTGPLMSVTMLVATDGAGTTPRPSTAPGFAIPASTTLKSSRFQGLGANGVVVGWRSSLLQVVGISAMSHRGGIATIMRRAGLRFKRFGAMSVGARCRWTSDGVRGFQAQARMPRIVT